MKMRCFFKLLFCFVLIISIALFTTSVNAQPLATAVRTIFLQSGPGGEADANVGYHPGFQYYYAADLGNPNRAAWVFDSSGTRLQEIDPINIDVRAWNYNSNTNQLEVVSYNALGGGAQRGLILPGVDGAGLLTGGTSTLLATMPGNISDQTMPAYDSANNRFYSRGTTNVVNIVSRVDGSLSGTINLDFASAGVINSDVTNHAIGYDPAEQWLIVTDEINERALVFDLSGGFIGASTLDIDVQWTFRMGYANGQLFVVDTSRDGWQGYYIAQQASVVPVPTMNEWGMIIFIVLAGLGAIYYLRRKRIES